MKHTSWALGAALFLSFPSHANMTTAERALDRMPIEHVQGGMREIAAVNAQVNDLGLTDCKAATYEKMRRLERYGITALFVTVRTETGGYHAIAVIDGRIALDNRRKFVTTVDELRRDGYQIARLN